MDKTEIYRAAVALYAALRAENEMASERCMAVAVDNAYNIARRVDEHPAGGKRPFYGMDMRQYSADKDDGAPF